MLTEYSSVTVLDVTAPVAPARAATPATGATSDANSASSQTDTEFRLFGNDGFTFSDLMDIINPLQHIPVVSSIYRSLSGDEIDPGARIAGGTLFGGPIGAAASVANTIVEYNTGKDVGEHVAGLFQDDATPSVVAAADETVADFETAAGPVTAENSAASRNLEQFSTLRAPFSAPASTAGAAGMSAIPVAREDTLAGYYQQRNVIPAASVVPDLGLLGKISDKPPVIANTPAIESATPPPALFRSANAPSAPAVRRAANGWVYDAMLRALEKYQVSARAAGAPGGQIISVDR